MNQHINGLYPQQLARQLCNKGKSGCDWYHGNWHLLKALGVVSTSAIHEQSLCQLLKLALTNIAAPRILITGSTDETLVRLAYHTCHTLGLEAKLYAVDICATPLAFMQAYAKEQQIELETCCSNILDFKSEHKFDVILTHAFMGYFDDIQRPLLIKKWKQLLADEGSIVTIQRVRSPDSPALVTFTAQQSAQFIARALEAAKIAEFNNQADLDAVRAASREFTENFVNHAIRSKTTLESLFTEANMTFYFLEYQSLEKKDGLSGPSVPFNAEFAHIIAKKIPG